ncbi:Transcription factor [Aspergillus sclerotialis]|uniref:Transcription factor n=1 Tax=Aspergillus sclerotialis TaxID=2070753 RepID=A0A3A2ZW11_9EURO|nr:Transcription factor [Aspergillus sclerotialis]
MSKNYEARSMDPKPDGKGVFAVFARVVLQTWGVRETFLRQQGVPLETPRIVFDIRNKVTQMNSGSSMTPSISNEQPLDSIAISTNPPMDSTHINPSGHSADEEAFSGPGLGPASFPDVAGPSIMDIDIDQFWTTIDWNADAYARLVIYLVLS